MSKITVEKSKNFTQMSNFHFWEVELSMKATGLLSYMLFLPDTWEFTTEGLCMFFPEGRDCMNATLNELEKFGYLERFQRREKNGKLGKMEYVLYEAPNRKIRQVPLTDKQIELFTNMERVLDPVLPQESDPVTESLSGDYPSADYPSTEKPLTDKPFTEKPYTDNPYTVKPNTAEPFTEKPTQLNTNTLNTKELNTYQSIDRPMEGLVDNIREQIEYDIISQEPGTKDLLDDIVEILVELKSLCATNELVKIGRKNYQAELILHKLSRLRCSHVQYVMDCFRENPKKKSNIKAYLQQTLLNATDTMDSYYESRVRSDMSIGRIR